MQTYTTDEARAELALHLGPAAIEAFMLTAQEHGQCETRDTDGHTITLFADDDMQTWAIGYFPSRVW